MKETSDYLYSLHFYTFWYHDLAEYHFWPPRLKLRFNKVIVVLLLCLVLLVFPVWNWKNCNVTSLLKWIMGQSHLRGPCQMDGLWVWTALSTCRPSVNVPTKTSSLQERWSPDICKQSECKHNYTLFRRKLHWAHLRKSSILWGCSLCWPFSSMIATPTCITSPWL